MLIFSTLSRVAPSYDHDTQLSSSCTHIHDSPVFVLVFHWSISVVCCRLQWQRRICLGMHALCHCFYHRLPKFYMIFLFCPNFCIRFPWNAVEVLQFVEGYWRLCVIESTVERAHLVSWPSVVRGNWTRVALFLLCFVLFAFSGLCLVTVLSVFYCPVFSSVSKLEWHSVA